LQPGARCERRIIADLKVSGNPNIVCLGRAARDITACAGRR
jgi:hypothetical protein